MDEADVFVGEIKIFASWFAPVGWALCDGRTLPVAGHEELYEVIGDSFGKPDAASFKLPDLRGRVPIHCGQGAGLSARTLGETGGAESVTLTVENLPKHTHSPRASTANGDSDGVAGNFWAKSATVPQFTDIANINVEMNPQAMGAAGKNAAHDNMMPFMPLNFIIALKGRKPIR